MGPVHGQSPVIELQAEHGFLQAREEFLADAPHPPAGLGVVGAGEGDAVARGGVYGLGGGERQTQPVVDRSAHVLDG
ncbi:hypothetical protein [Streptomyces rhizosphaerihabitans]|uniref:hypothetical protein n=1 Tax=Streptomyces rhizosphaerihabitans TaxID=1266770 RepID=UPI0037044D24